MLNLLTKGEGADSAPASGKLIFLNFLLRLPGILVFYCQIDNLQRFKWYFGVTGLTLDPLKIPQVKDSSSDKIFII